MLNEKELWRLTFREFMNLYQAYKDQFDFELCLKLGKKTFAQAEADAMKAEEWF